MATDKATVFARESSANSLKELVIILTGLTITSGFLISVKSVYRFFGEQQNEYVQVWESYFWQLKLTEGGNIVRLILLVICVLRFHHGNIMFIDKNYLSDRKHNNNRNIWIDFIAVLAMSIGFSAMGFSTFHPVLFNTAYMVILLISVLWSSHSLVYHLRHPELNGGQTAMGFNGHQGESETQFQWFRINSFTLAAFIAFFLLPIPRRDIFLSGIIFINSALDVYVNRREYFPKLE